MVGGWWGKIDLVRRKVAGQLGQSRPWFLVPEHHHSNDSQASKVLRDKGPVPMPSRPRVQVPHGLDWTPGTSLRRSGRSQSRVRTSSFRRDTEGSLSWPLTRVEILAHLTEPECPGLNKSLSPHSHKACFTSASCDLEDLVVKRPNATTPVLRS